MKYEREHFVRNNFLTENGAIPIGDGMSMIYFGFFPLAEFADLGEFSLFAQNISSLAQAWYPEGDLDDAYSWYMPDERKSSWIATAKKKVGAPVDWIVSKGYLPSGTELLPAWSGEYYALDSDHDFSIVGVADSGYFDIFLAEAL